MSNKVFINCKEASTICDKTEYREATSWEKFKLRVHLFLCKKRSLYSEQNKVMTKIFCAHLLNHPDHIHLPGNVKESFKAKLKEQIN